MDLELHVIASLARLELSESEKSRLQDQLKAILGYVKQLDELDTTDVPPTAQLNPLATPFREDEVGPHLSRDQTLANAPRHDGESFVVPKVV